MKINNIFSTLKNLQLSKDKLLLILLGGVLLVIISLPVKGKNEADNTADSRDTGEAVEYEYADISDYSEWKTGRRATGLIFSSSSMSQKFGWTIGGALTGWLLAYFGFKANVIQSDFAQTGICMMMSIFPAIATMLSAFFISRYPLNEKRLYEISTELEERRKK